MAILTIAIVITGVFVGRGGPADSGLTPLKHKRALKNWLSKLAHPLRKLFGKATEALHVFVGSVAGAILSFLGMSVEFIAEHTLALIVLAAEVIGV